MSGDINVQSFSGKVNINNNLLVGSSHLFVDTVNNRVGITTASPDAGLHVNSNAYVHTDFRVGSGIVMNDTNGRITAGSFVGDGSAMTGINSDSGSWAGAGTGSVYLSTSTDNVGIGKTPSEKLDVEGIIRVNRNGGSLQLVGTDHTYIEYYPDGVSSGRKAYVGYAGGSDNNFTISNSAGSGHVILAGGSVGIGVTDPDSKLEVRGNIRASFSDTNHGMFIDAGGTILRNYGGNGAGLHFTGNAIFPTNYLGSYSAGGIDLGSSTYRWNNVYTEALNASGTITASTFTATSRINIGTSASIRQSSTSSWTGDPGSGVGKLEYHSNRWYIVAGSNSTELLQVRRNDTNKFTIDNNGSISLGIVPAARISGTVASATNADTVDGQHAHEMSWGHDTTHGTYTNFNSFINTDKFGAHYVTGTTNGPGQSGPTQYYHQRLSLGSNHNNYSLQLAIGRNRSDNYLWYRNEENGSVGGWNKMRAGYADSAGNADTVDSLHSSSFFRRDTSNDVDVRLTAADGRGLRFWDSDSYKIYMSNATNGTWGGRLDSSDYNMYFRMTGGTTRGFVFLNNRTVRCHINGNGDLYLNGGWLRTYGQRGWYNETYAGGWYMTDSSWVKSYNGKGLYVNNQIRMASLRALGGTFASRLDWPNSGHHVDCYHNLSGHVFHINHYALQPVYLNRHAYSDRRIKEDIKDIDDVSALNVLRKIKPKTYKYKLQPHKGTVYGFIAQDVREVLPYATNLTKLSAPFDREKFVNATILENGVVNLDKPCNELEIGKNAYFYYESSTSTRDFEVTEITSPTQFRVRIDEGGTEWIGNTILVGKEVDDFHGIDKDAIFTVATAALQEVDRQLQAEKVKTHQMEEDLQAEKARTYELQKKVELLEMSHTSLIQRIEALENL